MEKILTYNLIHFITGKVIAHPYDVAILPRKGDLITHPDYRDPQTRHHVTLEVVYVRIEYKWLDNNRGSEIYWVYVTNLPNKIDRKLP